MSVIMAMLGLVAHICGTRQMEFRTVSKLYLLDHHQEVANHRWNLTAWAVGSLRLLSAGYQHLREAQIKYSPNRERQYIMK